MNNLDQLIGESIWDTYKSMAYILIEGSGGEARMERVRRAIERKNPKDPRLRSLKARRHEKTISQIVRGDDPFGKVQVQAQAKGSEEIERGLSTRRMTRGKIGPPTPQTHKATEKSARRAKTRGESVKEIETVPGRVLYTAAERKVDPSVDKTIRLDVARYRGTRGMGRRN